DAGPAAGGNVRDAVAEAELLQRRRTVAAADNTRRAVAGGPDDRLGHLLRADFKRLRLEHTQGPVPDDRAGVENELREPTGGLGTDVKAHPAVLDVLFKHLHGGHAGDLLAADVIDRENQLGVAGCGGVDD